MTKLGPFGTAAEAILAYRRAIKAEQVQLFTDLRVKYTTPISGPEAADAFGARRPRPRGPTR
ncbi:MAG: hypothetical protein IPN47_13005 [Gemmatimonadetes bacterium]|nr:hypothetical protein [Gemmatimonadota bacterium]